jgi:hypothetical protein
MPVGVGVGFQGAFVQACGVSCDAFWDAAEGKRACTNALAILYVNSPGHGHPQNQGACCQPDDCHRNLGCK